MPEKDPTTWAAGTWALAFIMAIGGGVVSWVAKVRKGHTKIFNIVELIGECMISGFVGLGAFMTLAGLEYPIGVCAGVCGVCGHMGTRLLFAVEHALETRLQHLAGKQKGDGV